MAQAVALALDLFFKGSDMTRPGMIRMPTTTATATTTIIAIAIAEYSKIASVMIA